MDTLESFRQLLRPHFAVVPAPASLRLRITRMLTLSDYPFSSVEPQEEATR